MGRAASPKVGSIPQQGKWVEPAATTEEWVDPALAADATLYQEVDPNALATEWVDPAAAPVAEAPVERRLG